MSIVRGHGTRRRLVAVALVALAALLATGCDWQLMVPPGDAPLRYRDEVFTTVQVTKDLTYGSATNQSGQVQALTLDLYRPPATDTVTRRPAIVWIHGGAFQVGDKNSAEIVDEANVFARKGYVGVSINYRLATSGCIGTITAACLQAIVDAKHDAQAAVRWLRANAATHGIDPARIATAGSSAGAITALNVGYGPEDVGDSGNPGYDSTVAAAVSLSGQRILTRANPGEAAALLFHGTADPLVPYAGAQTTVDEALAAGLAANLTTWDGAGHVPYVAHRTEILDQTTNFLWWTLDLAGAER
ncbi:MAG: alpha/beta hydrolase [Actinobacteria bacterium]|nr:alpha/beta hydrolase [Actinomycetota bacterium]